MNEDRLDDNRLKLGWGTEPVKIVILELLILSAFVNFV